ncbi:MAG: DNA-processing protein DprA [Candidatus Omnitrophica bacterium]|nr:DNA-processing protein DprA [Candidatus Omnitrophota bacterium]
MTERDALMVLNAMPGVGNATIQKLVQHFGSAQQVLSLPVKDWIKGSGLSRKVVEKIFDFDQDKFLKNEYNLLTQNEIEVVTFFDENYPTILKEIPDAPVVLYVKGRKDWDASPMVAVVGSRRASLYGMTTAQQFAMRLAELGITVISGMARGIDTAAHQGALKAGGTTIAVLGNGLTEIFPRENKKLLAEIAQKGTVISEFPLTMPPLPHNFLQRNRIVSGFSLGVLVVEAARHSGALVTARLALEQGRDVFAIPGQVGNATAQGTNDLIRQGAKLVTCVEDILEELQRPLKKFVEPSLYIPEISSESSSEVQELENISTCALSEREENVYTYISKDPIDLDSLVVKTKQPVSTVMPVLLQLEMKRLIKQLPGKWFIRKQ